jgi:hypothetical protein
MDQTGLLYVIGFVVLLFRGLSRINRLSEGWRVLFAAGIVLVPLPLILLRLFLHPESTTVFPRYFLTSILLFLLLAGFLLGELIERGGRGRILGGLVLLLLLAGNAVCTMRFTQIGRGQYLPALSHIVQETPDRPVHLAGNSDFRTPLIVSFYSRYLPKERQIVYHPGQKPNRSRTVDWWIVEFLEPHEQVPQDLETVMGRFSLERYYDFYGPSGCGWAIYRRIDR